MIDLHAHLLPGLDDGAESIEESLAMCRAMVADGVHIAVATPHMGDALYDVPREVVIEGVARLGDALLAEHIPLAVLPGGDVHLERETLTRLERHELVTVADGGRYMLVELPNDLIPPGIDELFFEMQLMGVVPIVTHPERIRDVQTEPSLLVPLVESGALIQVTAQALVRDTDNSKRSSSKCARQLLEWNLVHVVASDAHSAARFRPPGLSAARQVVAELAGEEVATTIFERTPEAIIQGCTVVLPDPVRPRKNWLSWL